MIKAVEIIKTKIKHQGLNLKIISEYTGIKQVDLIKSLNNTRKFQTAEVLSLCALLGLKLSDFSSN